MFTLKKCDDIIHESVSLYLRGDDVIRSHTRNAFFSGYEKHYSVSKVVDRIDSYQVAVVFWQISKTTRHIVYDQSDMEINHISHCGVF